MSNTLKALYSLVQNPIREVREVYVGNNRANNTGDALEEYIKDLYAGTLDQQEEVTRVQRLAECFSYFGNTKNPPDMILHGSDAIEVKKLESPTATIQLNSSYPKARLFSDSSMITASARNCEEWAEKDMLYVVAYIPGGILRRLWFVYGDCFAAPREVYEDAKRIVKKGLDDIQGLEFAETDEIGRVNRVDPLGITNLRIRGMWIVENPQRIFSYLNVVDPACGFQSIAIMRRSKFDSFSDEDRSNLLNFQSDSYNISDVSIKNPENPAQLLEAKLINFKV